MHQSFFSDADRLAALERLDQAWEMFLDADTNPFREQWEADRVWRHQLQEDLQTSEQRLEAQRLEVESLERRTGNLRITRLTIRMHWPKGYLARLSLMRQMPPPKV